MKLSIKLLSAVFCFGFPACGPAIYTELDNAQMVLQEQKVVDLIETATLEMRNYDDIQAIRRAEAALELAREIKPRDERVIDGLGCIAWRKSEFGLAEYFFKKAIEINPKYDRAYAHLALVAWRKGDKQIAQELNSIALQLNPLNHRARNNYAALLIEDKKFRKAYSQLLRASEGLETSDRVLEHNLNLSR